MEPGTILLETAAQNGIMGEYEFQETIKSPLPRATFDKEQVRKDLAKAQDMKPPALSVTLSRSMTHCDNMVGLSLDQRHKGRQPPSR